MLGDDLNQPLGLDRDETRKARDLPWGAFALGGIGLLAVGLVVFSRLTDEPMGGEPFAVASIDRPAPAQAPSVPAPAAPRESAEQAVPARQPAGDAEVENGVRVVRSGGAAPPGALIIQVPDALGLSLPPAPDRRLVEKGPHGLLPRIGVDGARPGDVYARPVQANPKLKLGSPRIALVVGGMGISQTATDHAIEVLPGVVTLAFAPYGADVAGLAAKARAQGHELVLQVPMESFDTGQNPGPHTLQVSLSPEQNLDHLHWTMSRFAGYVGVMNFLGGKFTAQQASLAPVAREVARRGLLWLDDGSSARSIAKEVGDGVGLGVMQTQINLEGMTGEALEAALSRLEKLAREKGSATAVASGLPATVDRLATFARGLERRGIALVPVSALAQSAGRSTASVPE